MHRMISFNYRFPGYSLVIVYFIQKPSS